ncbi:helix-turn-helix domain-containing protein [Populibacterium corticicola]|uniref:Helix-turn-helix domain-containing protein n=1 Tax=Populibacterium corticicola TaxID=1812826 RepID=A0ABW5XA92_9MICO
MNVYTEDDWKRLGQEIVRRRIACGYLTAKDLAEAVGVTPRVIGDLENGRRTNYGPATLVNLEKALGWGSQSLYALLGGGQATLVEQQKMVKSSRLQEESERDARAQLEVSSESTEQLVSGIQLRVNELRKRVETADALLAEKTTDQRAETLMPGFEAADIEFEQPEDEHYGSQDEYDLVADDADGWSHEDEDEQREMEP